MDNKENKIPAEELTDEALDKVTGGRRIPVADYFSIRQIACECGQLIPVGDATVLTCPKCQRVWYEEIKDKSWRDSPVV